MVLAHALRRVALQIDGLSGSEFRQNDVIMHQTDLSLRELLWFVEPALGFDFSNGLQSGTLTGDGTVRYNGVSWCYQLDPDAALELVNDLVNPYTTDITAGQMNIFQAQ